MLPWYTVRGEKILITIAIVAKIIIIIIQLSITNKY